MRRLRYFLKALSWGARLQILAVVIILGWWLWWDFRRGHWPVSVGIILFSWLFGWAIKGVMAAHPRQTSRTLGAIGIVIFLLYILAGNQKWWRLLITHFARELFLWLELSCEFWFLSELRLRQERDVNEIMLQQFGPNNIDHGDRFGFRNDDFGDQPPTSKKARN